MGHTGDKEPAMKLWCSWEPEGAGTEQTALAGRCYGTGSPDRHCGEALELAVPTQGLGVPHSAINHCVTPNPKYITTKRVTATQCPS